MSSSSFFFFNDTATTEIYTLSLHDALPICGPARSGHSAWFLLIGSRPRWSRVRHRMRAYTSCWSRARWRGRSEEHTSELQSLRHLVCRLLLEKKKKKSTDAVSLVVAQQSSV